MPQFKAAAGKVDLEPLVGGWMSGFAARLEPSQGTHDPITARALLMQTGDTDVSGTKFPKHQAAALAIVVCDLLGFSPESVVEMRRRIAERTAIPAGNILIACTHTHSGPTSLPMRGVLGCLDKDWLAHAQHKIVALVSRLPANLEPARLAHASAPVTGVGFNRQDKSRPHDEELVVISLESESGETIATVANYAAHAVVLGSGWMLYSADFPGEVNRRIEESRGGVSLYLQGACGDVNPCIELRGNFEDCERIGETLSGAAVSAIADTPRTSEVSLTAASKFVDVSLDPPPALEQLDERIAGFEADKAAAVDLGDAFKQAVADAMLEWAHDLRELIIRDAVPETISAEVFAAAINDIRIVGLPFETYSDIGLGIKRGLKPARTMFVGYANGLFGYCPTDWAKDQGGYGPAGSFYWFGALATPIGFGAADLLVKESITLGKSLLRSFEI